MWCGDGGCDRCGDGVEVVESRERPVEGEEGPVGAACAQPCWRVVVEGEEVEEDRGLEAVAALSSLAQAVHV